MAATPDCIDIVTTPLTDGHVARLTIDAPEPGGLNIISSRHMVALSAALDELAQDADLRALVLTGAGERAFIGGADIKEMVGLDPARARAFITALHGVCKRLRTLPVPVIARIRGYCLGGGLEVAACCDMRVAGDDATFGMPEVKVGIPSVIEAAVLPRLVGIGKAREMVLTGATFGAQEALAIGLVERVVPPAELDAAVDQWLGHIGECGRHALAAQKALCRAWEEEPLARAIDAGIDAFAAAYETDEPATLMGRFAARSQKTRT